MADPTLYLFDGFNVLHAGGFADARRLGVPAVDPLWLDAGAQRGGA